MKRWLVGLVAVLLVAGAGWFWFSPIMAMHNLGVSAQAGDRAALSDEVDFPAVRQSLKDQFRAIVGGPAADKDGTSGFAALGRMLAGAIADTVIETVVSPDGIRTLVSAGRLNQPGQTNDDNPDARTHWAIERQGPNRFVARPVKPGEDRPPELVFSRVGLGWRLTDIRLPADSAK